MRTELIFLAVSALVAIYVISAVYRGRGWRGAMFGAPVLRTVGEVDLGKEGLMHTRLRVHQLKPDEASTPTVGLEILKTSVSGFSMIPLRLTVDPAQMLKQLLEQSLEHD